MKYIRTKDGIFEVDGYDDRGVCVCGGKAFYRDEYIKQADTIEELCDEFVYAFKDNRPVIVDEEQIKTLTLLNQLKFVYGAIWTDKGLIYVAKLNEKGELVLI